MDGPVDFNLQLLEKDVRVLVLQCHHHWLTPDAPGPRCSSPYISRLDDSVRRACSWNEVEEYTDALMLNTSGGGPVLRQT